MLASVQGEKVFIKGHKDCNDAYCAYLLKAKSHVFFLPGKKLILTIWLLNILMHF